MFRLYPNMFTLIDRRREEFFQVLFPHVVTKEASNSVQNSSREDASSKDCMEYIFSDCISPVGI